ncbi:MAG: GNAT family N-acetyltransferase [Prevotella sp.]|nr:GNAT family N-acetyltransferase [Prevotella sp.]
MDYEKFRFQRLEPDTPIDNFECVDSDLNDFLREEAKAYQAELLSVTYLVYYDGQLAAYFSLLNDLVRLEETEKRVRNRINRKIPFAKQRNHYAAVKLGRLAVDRHFAHQGIGEMILKVIPTMFLPRNKTGCRFLTVDALATATAFYEQKGCFRFFTEQDEGDDTRLMYFDLKDFG